MRKLLALVGAAVVVLVGVILVRAALFGSAQPPVDAALQVSIPEGAADRLAGSLRIPTISHDDPAAFDAEAFQALHKYLATAFPLVHSQLLRDTVTTYSLLYTWQGRDSSLPPILLAGHLDVVPIEPGTEDQWLADPFGGQITDGFIWGRGAIDNKSAVVGLLEAVEMLLGEGFRPARTVYLAFGHDEELGGVRGAREIAALLERRGVELEMVLDEGGVIGLGVLPGIDRPVALVGIAEKGFVTVELSTRTGGGHSSMPPRQSAVGILSAAIAQLEAHPMPARLDGPTLQLFDRIGPLLPFAKRAIFANLWLTRALVLGQLEGSPSTNAMIRTTTAATVFQGGAKNNVLPSHARAVVNFRILQGDSVAGVVQHVKRVIDDPRVEVATMGSFSAEPSPMSSADSEVFRTLEQTIRSVSPDAIVAPYLVVVATDARYYSGLCRNVFRFLPLRLTPQDLDRIHGLNERLAVAHYEEAIRMYRQLIFNVAGR